MGQVNQNLREIIEGAGEEDQTMENAQIVMTVFSRTAALLSQPTVVVEIDVSELAIVLVDALIIGIMLTLYLHKCSNSTCNASTSTVCTVLNSHRL